MSSVTEMKGSLLNFPRKRHAAPALEYTRMQDLSFELKQASWVCRGHTGFQSAHDNLLLSFKGKRWHRWGEVPTPPAPRWPREAPMEEGCLLGKYPILSACLLNPLLC